MICSIEQGLIPIRYSGGLLIDYKIFVFPKINIAS
jgi:hypothetical protein